MEATALYIHVYQDFEENNYVLSTSKFSELSFATALPGGFAEASFMLPKEDHDPQYWYDRLLAKFVVITDACGERVYEGTVEALETTEEGLTVELVGLYAQASLVTVTQRYTDETPVAKIMRDLCSFVPAWRGVYVDWRLEVPPMRKVVWEWGPKVSDCISEVLKQPTNKYYNATFGIYENRSPWYFTRLMDTYKVARNQMSMEYGASVSLSGVYNKIQANYQNEQSTPQHLDFASNQDSINKYHVREATLEGGQVLKAQILDAQELAVKHLSKAVEQETITLKGYVYHSTTSLPVPVYFLRAGMRLLITDLAANNHTRYLDDNFNDIAGFFVTKTSYNHSEATMEIEVGDGLFSFEQFMEDTGVSAGSVK